MRSEPKEVPAVARYRELGPLGSGGMATVTLAEDTLLRRRVALKRLHTSASRRELARLQREALVGASLNHPNLVTVYDVYDEDDGELVIVMEYVRGETLDKSIRNGGALAPGRAVDILRQVALALDAIHARGVIHRDVKPANVLLGADGAVKLADLGIAAAADRTQTTAGADIAGTFSYMAPEQLEGQTSNAAIDIYALSAVAFEMLSGCKARGEANPVALAHAISTRPPPDLRAVWRDAPADAATVLQKGMSADPAGRPGSAGALVAGLAEALEPRTTEVHVRPATDTRGRVPAGPGALASARPVARRVPRTKREPRTAGGSPRAMTTDEPPLASSAPGRPPGPRSGPHVAPPPRRVGPKRHMARGGALVALLLVVAAVVLFAGLGSRGASKKSTSAPKPGKVGVKHVSRSATAARSGPPSDRSAGQDTSADSAAAASQASPTATPTTAAPPVKQPPAPSPAATVEAFYGHAARHEYAAAWQLADPSMRDQLAGFDSFQAQQSAVRSITFHRAETLAGTEASSSATVSLETTAVLKDRTEHCGGTARLVRGATGGWLLHGISINCTP